MRGPGNIKVTWVKRRGFTLLETLLSIALLLTLVSAVTLTLRNSVDIRLGLRQRQAVTRTLDITMHRLNYDLEHLFVISWYERRAEQKRRTLFRLDRSGSELLFTYAGHRFSHPDAHEGEIALIQYRLEPWDRFPQRYVLRRGELGRIPSDAYDLSTPIPMQTIATNLAALRVEAWNGERWSDAGWDSQAGETRDLVPHMLRIVLRAWDDDPDFSGQAADISEVPQVELATVVVPAMAHAFDELKIRNASFRLDL